MKKVKRVYKAEKVDMSGMLVDQALPLRGLDQVDPFLLIHHHFVYHPPGGNARRLGIGPHPHTGFSPVTFIFKGDVHHRDSHGNSSVVKAGGIQWMNAGKGVIHSERPSKELAENGGEQEIIQIWINTPKAEKIKTATYQAFQNDELPKIKFEGGSFLNVQCGNISGIEGPAKSPLRLIIATGNVLAGSKIFFQIPENHNTMIYFLDGQVDVNGQSVNAKALIHFENEGKNIEIESGEESRFLLMAGIPTNEQIFAQGPFVMSSQEEIMRAIRDYQNGRMGMLIEDFD
ncbi:MAG: pirin family protein [Melioribacteraceae bacterium]|nr:pirin family protein [Melioribacteraceae bacterium]MCF8264130.1 pirin family protein [Melioribacteraceae bacterium]MCF8432269.1 pirin family protein [Melioribacteraceae bacterium]